MAIRLGLVVGGPGAFIGSVHRIAAELDRRIVLVAGAFSSSPERSRAAGLSYGIDVDRAYPDLATMIAAERARPDGIGMIAIATPTRDHMIRVTPHAFDDFAAAGSDPAANRGLLGIA